MLVGVASSLVVLAMVVTARAAKPKRPEKCEKAQIVKRLLALSEREDIVNGRREFFSVCSWIKEALEVKA